MDSLDAINHLGIFLLHCLANLYTNYTIHRSTIGRIQNSKSFGYTIHWHYQKLVGLIAWMV